MNTFSFNGIDGKTGTYFVPPLDEHGLAGLASSSGVTKQIVKEPTRQILLGIDENDPSDAGWAIVFHQNERPVVRAMLAPLIDHRRQILESGKGGALRHKVLDYRDGEDALHWLLRFKAFPGTVTPNQVPSYLLFVGNPAAIPFSVTDKLSGEYAVGRIAFDKDEDYRLYAESLVRYETNSKPPNAKETVFFATQHDGDEATRYSRENLVEPLIKGFEGIPGVGAAGFSVESILGDNATKTALTERLKGRAPALLFTASHGLIWNCASEKQRSTQGSLLCAEWPGLGEKISEDSYIAAVDVPYHAVLDGMVAFLYACCSAGTPVQGIPFPNPGRVAKLAPAPFCAALPSELLAHGALAVIGHVAPSLASSFMVDRSWSRPISYAQALARILKGMPLGIALRDFRDQYAQFSNTLLQLLYEASAHIQVSDLEIASCWARRNDAEGFLLMGDPAVRLRVAEM